MVSQSICKQPNTIRAQLVVIEVEMENVTGATSAQFAAQRFAARCRDQTIPQLQALEPGHVSQNARHGNYAGVSDICTPETEGAESVVAGLLQSRTQRLYCQR